MQRVAHGGEVAGERVDVVNAGVVPLVAPVGRREEETGGAVDGRYGEVLRRVGGREEELQGAAWVLWFSRAGDGEGEAPEHDGPPVLKVSVKVGGDGDVWPTQRICSQGGR